MIHIRNKVIDAIEWTTGLLDENRKVISKNKHYLFALIPLNFCIIIHLDKSDLFNLRKLKHNNKTYGFDLSIFSFRKYRNIF